MRIFHFILTFNLYSFVHSTTQTSDHDTQTQPNNQPETVPPAQNDAEDNFQFDYELEDHNDNPETGQHNSFIVIKQSFFLGPTSTILNLPFHGRLDDNRYRYDKSGWEFEVFLCPAEKKEEKQLISDLSKYYKSAKYCLIKKPIPKDEPKLCKHEVRPVLIRRDPPGFFNMSPTHFYQFAYQNCESIEKMTGWLKNKSGCINDLLNLLPGDRRDATTPGNFWPMYEINYHTKQQRTIFTKHFMMTPQLLNDVNYLPQPSFDITKISTESYNLQDNRFDQMDLAFQQQENSSHQMVAQLLVPIEDFAIDHWKKTTLHYINVKPLWNKLQPLMYIVNDRVRKMAISISQKTIEAGEHELKLIEGFFIHTMAFNSPKVQVKEKLYLGNNQNFPIPNIWIKMVYFLRSKLGIAIIIQNTPNDPPTNKICNDTIYCDFKRWSAELDAENVISDEIAQYGYCCEMNPEIQKLFATPFPIVGVLEIDTLAFDIEPKNKGPANEEGPEISSDIN